jgi:predicted DNA binding CopG/RHH family protein
MRRTKTIPKFKSEDEERSFWASRDSGSYIDWSQGQRVLLPKLKPSLRTISLRLPEPMITRLKVLANKRDIPYQSLLKMLLAERLGMAEVDEAGDRRTTVHKRRQRLPSSAAL